MLTVKEAAEYLGKHPNTIRQWTKDYAEFLSPAALPAPGKERRFASDDMATFWTVAVLKSEGNHKNAVVESLATGLRMEPSWREGAPHGARSSPMDATRPEDNSQVKDAAALAVQLVQRQVDSLTNERDYRRAQLDSEREARMAAETDSARKDGELAAIYRRHWWQIWKPERPEKPEP